jgi:mRNA interferase HigB
MRIIARSTLKAYVARQANSRDRAALERAPNAWYAEGRASRWTTTADVKRRYGTASVISAERIVFSIKGNDYRLVVAVDLPRSTVWIMWIGTHEEYDRIDAQDVEHHG